MKELRETFENTSDCHFHPDAQTVTSTPGKIPTPALFNPVCMNQQVEVEKHNSDKTSSKTSVSVF